jgi:hypothetical protein
MRLLLKTVTFGSLPHDIHWEASIEICAIVGIDKITAIKVIYKMHIHIMHALIC